MAPAPYVYQKLKDPYKEIRLLRITSKKAPDAAKGTLLECSLSPYSIMIEDGSRVSRVLTYMRRPTYIAISHVWGEGNELNQKQEIMIDGKTFSVTQNIYDFLLTRLQVLASDMCFWIDMICINQRDDIEKSAQIPLMGNIYRTALTVKAWLGKDDKDFEKVMEFINKAGSSKGMTLKAEGMVNTLANRISGQGDVKQTFMQQASFKTQKAFSGALVGTAAHLLGSIQTISALASPTRDALSSLVLKHAADELELWEPKGMGLEYVLTQDLPQMTRLIQKVFLVDTHYFQRMWTLQEAVLAQDLSLSRGKGGARTEEILKTLFYLNQKHGIPLSTSVVNEMLKLHNLQEAFDSGHRLPLWRLLLEFRSRKCADLRDRIYAMQGIMYDPLNALLRSDYTKSVEEVYANATRHFIASRKSLDVICGHEYKKSIPTLPSWALDFTALGKNERVVPLIGCEIPYTSFNASRSEYIIKDTEVVPVDWKRLPVSGFQIGTIGQLSDSPLDPEPCDIAEQKWLFLLKSLSPQTPPFKMEALEQVSALVGVCTQFMTTYPLTTPSTPWTSNVYLTSSLRSTINNLLLLPDRQLQFALTYLITLICGKSHEVIPFTHISLKEFLNRTGNDDEDGEEKLKALCRLVYAGIRGRRLGILRDESGVRWVAVEGQTEIGDTLWVLKGCSVLVVLREVEDVGRDTGVREAEEKFRLIGEAFIEGMMDGQVISMQEVGAVKERNIILE